MNNMRTPAEQEKFLNESRFQHSGDKPSRKKPSLLLWLVVILFPMPFSPWWLTLICLAVFVFLLWVFNQEALSPNPSPKQKVESPDQFG